MHEEGRHMYIWPSTHATDPKSDLANLAIRIPRNAFAGCYRNFKLRSLVYVLSLECTRDRLSGPSSPRKRSLSRRFFEDASSSSSALILQLSKKTPGHMAKFLHEDKRTVVLTQILRHTLRRCHLRAPEQGQGSAST